MSNALPADQIAAVAKAAGFTGRDLTIAVAVCYGESGGKPDAVNHNTDSHRSNDFGLWQINDYWNPEILKSGSWSNPADNARMAYAVFRQQGWKAWYAYKNGSYLAHMSKAASGVAKIGDAPSVVPGVAPAVTSPATGNDGGSFGGFQGQLVRAGCALLGIMLVYFAFIQQSGIRDKVASLKSAASQAALLVATKGAV